MMRGRWTTILLILIFLAGLSLLLYPSFSDYWNSTRQTKEIASYVEEVTGMDPVKKAEEWTRAEAFNAELLERSNPYTLTEELRTRYEKLLNTAGNGIMAYVEIPALQVLLPVYHGTSESVLQRAIGHLDWTSLPVGGPSTHSVISGHRGLPSARLFTDLGKMIVGDVFMLQVLDETLTYLVDQILIVEPENVTALAVTQGEDSCTLVTCTPYGVNTHRILVRGHRIANAEKEAPVRIIAEAMQVKPSVVAVLTAIPLTLALLLLMALDGAIRSRRYR